MTELKSRLLKSLASIAVLSAVLTGCVTARFDHVPGMVYDSAGRPVNGARILLQDRVVASSDVNGRFSLSCAPEVLTGELQYAIGKAGFETRSLPVGPDYLPSPSTALYVRLESVDDLVSAAWDSIDAKRYDQAGEELRRAASVEAPGPEWAITMLTLLVMKSDGSREEAAAFYDAVRGGSYGSVPASWLAPFAVDHYPGFPGPVE